MIVKPNQRLEWFLLPSVLLLGLLQAWATRGSINDDVVSYLDMGDAFLRGDWATAINGTWNPLYGVLLASALRLTGAGPAHEYAVVHGMAFLSFVLALFAFRFFLRELVVKPYLATAGASGPNVTPASWLLLGYVLFTWSALDMVGVWTTNPDMLVAACVFAATGLLVRIHRDTSRYRDFVWLGVVLGVAYLVKGFMFFGSLVFLAVTVLASFRGAAPRRKAALAILTFLLISAPFAGALSYRLGHLTVGETGRINYAWFVNGIPSRHWLGGPAAAGFPVHPTRRLVENPPTFEFDRPIRVTYPAWYDPSYWYEGVQLAFRPANQLRVLRGNLAKIVGYSLGASGGFISGLLILSFMKPRWSAVGGWLRANWWFMAPSAVAIVLYALVYVKPRYVGGFFVVILMGAFMALAAGGRDQTNSLVGAIAVASGILLVVPVIGRESTPRYYSYLLHPWMEPVDPQQAEGGPSTAAPWRVVTALQERGLKAGDRIGTVQYANRADVTWARLARVKIVAQVFPEKPDQAFWRVSAAAQQRVADAMLRAGVQAIISDIPPAENASLDWQPLGDTGYYVHLPATAAIPATGF